MCPAALMLFLLLRNRRALGAFLRSVWLKGRLVLTVGVLAQLAAQAYYYIGLGGEAGSVGILLLVVYGYCLVYLLTNRRVKDMFSRVPQ